jgi:hypothetical protein
MYDLGNVAYWYRKYIKEGLFSISNLLIKYDGAYSIYLKLGYLPVLYDEIWDADVLKYPVIEVTRAKWDHSIMSRLKGLQEKTLWPIIINNTLVDERATNQSRYSHLMKEVKVVNDMFSKTNENQDSLSW